MKRAVLLLVLALLAFRAWGQPNGPAKGQAEFLDGLEHLEAGRWAEASSAFAKAIDQDEEAARYYLARGVSRVLAEDLKAGVADFDRVLRLAPNDKHARLWKSAATNMQGDFMKGGEIYPQATRDQYENQVQDMARLYGEYNFRKGRGESDPDWDKKWAADQAAAKASFREIAGLFAARVKGTTGELVPLMYDRAAKKIDARDFAGALADLDRAAESSPGDLRVMQARGTCHLNLGAPDAARTLFVRVLTAQPGNADAWSGHSLACAALGDAVRAKASDENAASLNPDGAKGYRRALAAALSTTPASDAPHDALAALPDRLRQLAATGATDDALLAQASAIIRATNAHRLRADETYLDTRVRLEAAARAKPKSADALADLGEFLYTQAMSIRGEAVEPRAAFASYRPQTDETQAQEIAQAEEVLGRALAANPRNVKALTYKAACAIFRLRWADAETLLKTALGVDARYGPLLETFAKVMDHAAGTKAVAASDLRSVKSWEDAYYYYYRRPSQAELQQADEYQRQAQALWAIAERHLEAAAKNDAGKPAGFYYAGVLAKRRGQADAARAAFERCVALAPDFAPAWDELTENYYRAGMKPEAVAARSAAANLQHTTGGHYLRLAWEQIVRTTYKSATETVLKAAAIDPADPRPYAYLAVITQAKGDAPAAMTWWRCAAAIELAHAQLRGIRPANDSPIDPAIVARAMAVNLRLARLANEQGQPDAAAKVFQTNLALGQRFGKIDRFTPQPASMLPDLQTDLTEIPEADSGFSLIAWSMLGLGEALQKEGREPEAAQQFAAVRQLQSQVPPTIDHRGRLADPCILATLAMLRPLVASKQFEQAQTLFRSGGCGGPATKAYADELRQLSQQIDAALANGRMEAADREAEEMRRRQLDELERFRKEREEQDRLRRRPPTRGPR